MRLLTTDHSDTESIDHQTTRSSGSFYFNEDYINANFVPVCY